VCTFSIYKHTFDIYVGPETEEPRLSSLKHLLPLEEDKRATKMDKILIIVSAVVGSLGVLSAIFGFSAEGTKLTVSTTDPLATFLQRCIRPCGAVTVG
jgi:hypothetical protein